MAVNRSFRSTQLSLVKVPENLTAVRLFFIWTMGLAAAALPQLWEHGKDSGRTIGTYSTLWVVLLGMVFGLALANLILLVLLFTRPSQRLSRAAERLVQKLARLGWLNLLGVLAAWVIYVFLVLYRYQKHFSDFLPQVWLFFLVTGVGTVFMLAYWKKAPYFWAWLFVAIVFSAGVKAVGYLPDISTYPFSLEWSEGSRFYYASLPYSRWLYGFQIPLSFLHPSRYLLQSMAFWVPGAGLWFSRFWQVVLWIGLSLLTGLALARRLKTDNRAVTAAIAVWASLFLQQGPVYYHLLVCVILVLVGFDHRKFWKTLIFIILASLWAGISRVNWVPVPAIIAASLYLLEKPVCAGRMVSAGRSWLAGWSNYLWQPLAWGVAGVLAGLASQAAYVLVSGVGDKSDFLSTFTSSLLWYRLFPSPTFPFGVLPSVLLVSAPLLILIAGSWLYHRSDWHWFRVLGIAGMLAVLFVGGVIVSTKIGGGSNIHNLDAFSSLLMIVGCALILGRFATETGGPPLVWRPWLLILTIVILPVVWGLNVGEPFVRLDFKQADYDLGKLNSIVQKYAKNGEVLFITQRQLEVFNLVAGVRMVPDYELLTLTEMSISNNQAYFERFNNDLRSHRFALIVANNQQDVLKNPLLDAFAEENNAWVELVARPIMKYYKEEMFFDTQGIQLLIPQ